MTFALGDIVWIKNNHRGDLEGEARHYKIVNIVESFPYCIICIKDRKNELKINSFIGRKVFPTSNTEIIKVIKKKYNHPLTPIFV